MSRHGYVYERPHAEMPRESWWQYFKQSFHLFRRSIHITAIVLGYVALFVLCGALMVRVDKAIARVQTITANLSADLNSKLPTIPVPVFKPREIAVPLIRVCLNEDRQKVNLAMSDIMMEAAEGRIYLNCNAPELTIEIKPQTLPRACRTSLTFEVTGAVTDTIVSSDNKPGCPPQVGKSDSDYQATLVALMKDEQSGYISKFKSILAEIE